MYIQSRRKRYVKRTLLSIAFLLTAFAVAEHASADERAEGSVLLSVHGNYRLYSNSEGCQITSTAADDTSGFLLFFGDAGYPIIAIFNDRWILPAGKKPISFQVDHLTVWEGDAITPHDNQDYIGIGIEFKALKEISEGKQITVEAGRWTKTFSLEGSREAIQALVRCTNQRSKSFESNPFAGDVTPVNDTNPFVDL